jgi:hypothetical protein
MPSPFVMYSLSTTFVVVGATAVVHVSTTLTVSADAIEQHVGSAVRHARSSRLTGAPG